MLQKEYTEYEKQNISVCESRAAALVQIAQVANQPGIIDAEKTITDVVSTYKKHENEYLLENITYSFFQSAVESDFGVFEGMIATYNQADADMGGIVSIGDYTSKIVGKNIVVTYNLIGTTANGTFKFTFENDVFGKLTGAEAAAKLTIGQNLKKAGGGMKNAALNTVLGMGTVFIVLILISFIISGFSLFNSKDKPKKETAPVEVPTLAVEENLADDTELVAVIMAAISAYEGNTSTDGFVVRSIRRANRRN